MKDLLSACHNLSKARLIIAATGLTLTLGLMSLSAHAQNRVDLDDMNVKGELLNDNRLRLSNRDKHQIRDRVSYRTNFRPEITDGLDVQWPEKNELPIEGSGGGQ